MSLLIYSLIYVATGIIVVMRVNAKSLVVDFRKCGRVFVGFNKKDDTSSGLKFEKKPIKEIITDCFLIPVFAFVVVVFIWPIPVLIAIKKKYLGVKGVYSLGDEIKIKKSEMVKKLSIAEIELQETIKDPLNAAPKLPFGFLNVQWLNFIDDIQESDEIWSFVKSVSSYRGEDTEEGYLILSHQRFSKNVKSIFYTNK